MDKTPEINGTTKDVERTITTPPGSKFRSPGCTASRLAVDATAASVAALGVAPCEYSSRFRTPWPEADCTGGSGYDY